MLNNCAIKILILILKLSSFTYFNEYYTECILGSYYKSQKVTSLRGLEMFIQIFISLVNQTGQLL